MKAFRLVLGLSLLLLALYVWYSERATTLPIQPHVALPQPSASAVNNPLPAPSRVPPPGMVYVPGGTFQMGRDRKDGGDTYDAPSHAVKVAPFFIDIYEVTNADYARFVDATHHSLPTTWSGGSYAADSSRKPVTGVSWQDAEAYARWAGKRLPTEAEWEFAARGTQGFLYPWGNEWAKGGLSEGSSRGPTEVGSIANNKSPFGVFDMVGNVWEWTANDLRAYPGGTLFLTENLKVIRGCMYQCTMSQMTTTYRRGWPATGHDYKNTGFRCAKSVKK